MYNFIGKIKTYFAMEEIIIIMSFKIHMNIPEGFIRKLNMFRVKLTEIFLTMTVSELF